MTMTDPLKQLIGTMYFSPARDGRGNPISQYEGVVAGFIVRRDDNSEFEVRSEMPLPYAGTLKKSELATLKFGTALESLDGSVQYQFNKAFPDYGKVWVFRDDGTSVEKDYTDLRRV